MFVFGGGKKKSHNQTEARHSHAKRVASVAGSPLLGRDMKRMIILPPPHI